MLRKEGRVPTFLNLDLLILLMINYNIRYHDIADRHYVFIIHVLFANYSHY